MEKKKILIVEDEILPAIYLKKYLDNYGYEVLSIATDGKEAIHKAINFNPDLLIMDICLNTNIDGIDVVEEVYKYQHIPVIYLTALTDEQTRSRAWKTKPVSMLDKPFSETELLRIIDNLFMQ